MNRLILLCVLFAATAHAQAGILAGKVVDGKTGETIIGATVMVEGTSIGATTDFDGNFNIPKVPAGKVNVLFRYIGYQEKKQEAEVQDKEVTNLYVSLNEDVVNLQEAVITAEVVKHDNASAIFLMQKNATTINSGISADEIKKSPDKSSGDVIRRVSGATIVDGKYAVIRGLTDRYNSAQLNNAMLPSTEPDRKTFAFDIFPASLLDNIIIIKTGQADLPGDFAGGLIQLNTRDIPEKSFFNITVGQSFQEGAVFKPYFQYQGGKKDFLGIDDGTRQLAANFPTRDSLVSASKSRRTQYSKMFANNWGVQEKKMMYPGQSYQLSGGYALRKNDNQFGVIAALTYANSLRFQAGTRSDFVEEVGDGYDYNDDIYTNATNLGALLNLSAQFKGKHRISLRTNYTINSEDRTVLRTGTNYQNSITYAQRSNFEFFSNTLLNTQLTSEHILGEREVKLRYGGGMAWITRDQPNTRRMSYAYNFDDPEDTIIQAQIAFQVNPELAGVFYSYLDEKNYNAHADVAVPFKLFKKKQVFKSGALYQRKQRTFAARIMGYKMDLPFTHGELLQLPQSEIFDTANMGAGMFLLDEITNPNDQYTASSNLYSAYAMFENAFGSRWKLVWGVRFEYFQQLLTSRYYTGDTLEINKAYPAVLPSAALIFSVNEQSNLRLSFSQTVGRPEFRELAPFAFYDFVNSATVLGFDSLKQFNVYNVDLRYEYFWGRGQAFNVSLFYKRFQNPIEQIIAGQGADWKQFSFANSRFANNVGVEVELRKNLDFIPGWKQWQNFTFSTNAAYIYSRIDFSNVNNAGTSKRPLQGQSPFVVNAGLQYAHPEAGTTVNLLFNMVGRRITQAGTQFDPDIWEHHRPLLDFQISQRFCKKGLVKFTISDLLAQNTVFYQNLDGNEGFNRGADFVVRSVKNYRTYSVTVGYTF